MDVSVFRQILFWPLSVENVPDGQSPVEAVSRLLTKDGKWQPGPPHPFTPGAPPTEVEGDPAQYSAAVYMHPFVQKILYPASDKGVPVMTRFQQVGEDQPRRLIVTLSEGTNLSSTIERQEMVLFRSGIVILVLELKAETPTPLSIIQRCLDELRRCYVPFWSNQGPGLVPKQVTIETKSGGKTLYRAPTKIQGTGAISGPAGLAPTLLPWWEALLHPLRLDPTTSGPYLAHVVDDRLPGMAFLTVNNPRALNRDDWTRLCFADQPGTGLPYASAFLADFEQRYCYDRFWDPTGPDCMRSRYLIAGYQFTFVGAEDSSTQIVLQSHFRHHYANTGLLLHYQQAALLRLMARLTPSSGNGGLDDPAYRAQLRGAQNEWLDFLGHGWFPTLSNQVQGQELFDLWRTHLRLPDLYREVSDKARDMTAMLNLAEGHEAAEAGLRLNRIAMVGLVASLIVGLLGINLFLPGQAQGMEAKRAAAIVVGCVIWVVMFALWLGPVLNYSKVILRRVLKKFT